MKKVLIGEKAGMTRVYDEDGNAVPVTAVECPDCVVVQKRRVDGRPSIQLGFDHTEDVNKPLRGHFDRHGVSPRRVLLEFIVEEDSPMLELDEADPVNPDLFEVGAWVDVSGRTKGRGFSGTVRRWNFSGGPKTHGGGFGRGTGSVGQSADPSRIFPGKKMPGHHGFEVKTVQNLQVKSVLPEEDVLLVSGSLPGSDGWPVVVQDAVKKGASTNGNG